MVHSWQYHAEYLYQNYESILVIAIAYSYMHCAAGSRHALHGMTKLCSDQIFDFIFQIKYSRSTDDRDEDVNDDLLLSYSFVFLTITIFLQTISCCLLLSYVKNARIGNTYTCFSECLSSTKCKPNAEFCDVTQKSTSSRATFSDALGVALHAIIP